MSEFLSLNKIYTVKEDFDGKIKNGIAQIEITGGKVSVRTTINDDINNGLDMDLSESLTNVSGVFDYHGPRKFFIAKVSGDPIIVCNFKDYLL